MTWRPQLMTWRGDYVPGTTYHAGSVVLDNGWLMIANKDTNARPAPQPVGNLFWVSGLGDTPAWTTNQETVSSLSTGQRYTTTMTFWITAVRLWVPTVAADRTHSLWLFDNPTTNLNSQQLIGSFTPTTTTGWITATVGNIISLSGSIFDLILLTNSLGTPSSNNGYWQYKQDSGIPSEGEVWHQGNNYEMIFNYTDKNDVNQESWLRTVTVGATINAGGQIWEVYGIDEAVSFITFSVTPAYRIEENEYTFVFNWSAPTTLDYVQITNNYPSPLPIGTVQGYFSNEGYLPEDGTKLNTNAYGVDLQIQEAVISSDWEVLSYSGR